jgi:hypothetical protein
MEAVGAEEIGLTHAHQAIIDAWFANWIKEQRARTNSPH